MMHRTKMWYDAVIASIIASNTEFLFVVDPAKITDCPEVKDALRKQYPTIVVYENELRLRKALREKEQDILIVFRDKEDIPFDLLSIYATIEIDLNDIFPLLNKNALLCYPVDYYQEIYTEYVEFAKDKYERLPESETNRFIDKIVSSETIRERKKALELMESLETHLEEPVIDCATWGSLSRTFGELMYLIHSNALTIAVDKIRLDIREKFMAYILNYYEDLIYSADSLIHPNILGRVFDNQDQRTALICFDCMGFEEWNVIREYLEKRMNLAFDIKYSFSMLPSETNYSRRALFAGSTPKRIRNLEFISGINWENEERLFKYYLKRKRGIDSNLIYFQRCVNARQVGVDYGSVGDYEAIGLVFSFVDQLIHSRLMDKRRLVPNIRMHLEKSKIDKFIESLLHQGFRVYFVSDHGSIFCRGNGVNVSKGLVDSRAKRYLISTKKELLEEYETEDSKIVQLKNIVGEDYLLLLVGSTMFAGRNEEGLTHGGLSMEEMVVPFIEVKYSGRI